MIDYTTKSWAWICWQLDCHETHKTTPPKALVAEFERRELEMSKD